MSKCFDCKKNVTIGSKRCKSCANKNRKGKYNKKGYKLEKSPRWRGGVTIYRRFVDLNSCSLCGKNFNLLVHHIDKNKYNNALSNLQVLCKECHNVVHKNWRFVKKNAW